MGTSVLAKIKECEVKTLGRYSSAYCYNFPSLIEFEITSRCNLKCAVCLRSNTDYEPDPPHDMALHDFMIILGRFRRLPRVQFCGTSEPLLNPFLPEMIEYTATRQAGWIEVITNGTLLSGDIALALSRLKLNMIKVSIDGPDPESYGELRGCELEPVLKNVRHFRAISSIPLGIECVVASTNIERLEKMPDLAKDLGASMLELRLIEGQSENVEKLAVYDERLLASLSRLIEEKCKRYGILFVRPNPQTSANKVCAAFLDVHVNHLGFLTPCFNVPRLKVGENLLDRPFEEQWNNTQMKELRRNVVRRLYPSCCKCSASLLAGGRVT